MLTATALFVGVGLGIFSARDDALAAARSAPIPPDGTPASERPVPPAIAGRIVEANPQLGQMLVRTRVGRFVLVNLGRNTIIRRGGERLSPEEARGLLYRGQPVLVLGRRNGDQLQALVVTLDPPGSPKLPAVPPPLRTSPQVSPAASPPAGPQPAPARPTPSPSPASQGRPPEAAAG